MNALDIYFRRPVLWDYISALVICFVGGILFDKGYLVIPKEDYVMSMASDLSNISLTLAGFILTLLTVLITFKSGTSKRPEQDNLESDNTTVFELFFSSDLYFQTVKHFKNCIKSLIIITVIGYSLKLGINQGHYSYNFFFNLFGLVIVILTLWRSLLILSKIIKMQH
jgi:hypothetical protein